MSDEEELRPLTHRKTAARWKDIYSKTFWTDRARTTRANATASWKLCRKLLALHLINASFSLTMMLYLPSVTMMISKVEAGSNDEIFRRTVVDSVAAVSMTLVGAVIGYVCEVFHSTRGPLIASVVACAAGNVLYSLSGKDALNSVWFLVVSRALTCGSAGVFSLLMTVIAAVTTPEERFPAFSQFRTVSVVSMALGGLASSLLGTINFSIGSYAVDPLTAPGLGAGVIMIVVIIYLLFSLEEKRPGELTAEGEETADSKNDSKLSAKELCQTYFSAGPFTAAFALFASATSIQSIYFLVSTQYNTQFKISFYDQGLLWTLIPVLSLFGSFAFELIDDLWKKRGLSASVNTAASAILCTVLGFVVVAMSTAWNSAAGVTAGATLVLMAYNTKASVLPTVYSLIIPHSFKFRLIPLFAAMMSAGRIVTPWIILGVTNVSDMFGNSYYIIGNMVPLSISALSFVTFIVFNKRLKKTHASVPSDGLPEFQSERT